MARAVVTLTAPVPTEVPRLFATSLAPRAAERAKATIPPRARRRDGVRRAAREGVRVGFGLDRGGGRGCRGRADERKEEAVTGCGVNEVRRRVDLEE